RRQPAAPHPFLYPFQDLPAMWAKKLALSVAALLFSVLFAEILVRLLGAAPEVGVIRAGRFQLSPNPLIGYEPVPDLDYQGESLAFYDYVGASNRLGYRDRDHAEKKPAGTFRILVLGDSIAAGLGVKRYEETFPAFLEDLLREKGIPVEVLNFGVSGYNTRQEVETLKDKGLRFDPDLVLLAYTLNDRERMDGDILKTLLEAEGKSPESAGLRRTHPLLVKSALYRLVRFRVLPRQAVPAESQDAQNARVAQGIKQVSGDTVAPSFAELARVAEAERIPVMVAVFPRFARFFSRYPFRDQHDFVRGLSSQHGFHHLDLFEDFRACKRSTDEPLAVDVFHPTAAGHRCAAEAMARFIVEQRLASR
ncbi:MAG TPA: SGNH/GDSL hydrolase family protein, partial [Thermoanaerobaculia bacterium]|nr:SGNH/GDSL hydrolase family protein [Thermoanaerobaculia bacterium]